MKNREIRRNRMRCGSRTGRRGYRKGSIEMRRGRRACGEKGLGISREEKAKKRNWKGQGRGRRKG